MTRISAFERCYRHYSFIEILLLGQQIKKMRSILFIFIGKLFYKIKAIKKGSSEFEINSYLFSVGFYFIT